MISLHRGKNTQRISIYIFFQLILILTYLQDLLVDLMQLIFTRKKSESKISWMIWKSWQTKLKKAKLKEALFCAMKKQMKTTQQTFSSGTNLQLNQKKKIKQFVWELVFNYVSLVNLGPLKKWTEHSQELHLLHPGLDGG